MGVGNTQITIIVNKAWFNASAKPCSDSSLGRHFSTGGWKTPPPPAMLDQKSTVGLGLRIWQVPLLQITKEKNINADWPADQWDEPSVFGMMTGDNPEIHKGMMTGDNPEIDTVQTPKRSWRLFWSKSKRLSLIV